MNIFLAAFASENLVSRDGFGIPIPRQSAHLHTQAESSCLLTGYFPSSAAASTHLFKTAIHYWASLELSGHVTAYRLRSLLRVCWHRASKRQRSSKRVLPWQVTMGQLISISLSHTDVWYEVGILKAPA